MKKITIDNIKFEGHDNVLNRISKASVIDNFKTFLDKEIEIPVSGILLACACYLVIIGFQSKKIPEHYYAYEIVVIEAGGEYEIY